MMELEIMWRGGPMPSYAQKIGILSHFNDKICFKLRILGANVD